MEEFQAIIICQNCGATNKDVQICRKCGALLPVSSKGSRSKILSSEEETNEEKNVPEMDLQEIPLDTDNLENVISNEVVQESEEFSPKEDIESNTEEDSVEVLKEITPQPFRSKIITSKKKVKSKQAKISQNSIKSTEDDVKSTLVKQKQLEKDMSKVLGFLSKKITVKELKPPQSKTEPEEKLDKEIPPKSMNEILNELLKLDLNIEASAIIKKDGTILASAISERISDKLFASIGQTLSQIGTDILDGLNAGLLKNMYVRGTEGVLDLAPIDKKLPTIKDMILIIFSQPKVKSGIITFAVNIVKKKVKQYLGM